MESLTAAVTLTFTATAVQMDDMAPAMALPFILGNADCENPVDLAKLKIVSDTAAMLADPIPTAEVVMEEADNDADDNMSVGERSVGSPCSVVSDTSSLASVADDFLAMDGSFDMDSSKMISNVVEIIPGPEANMLNGEVQISRCGRSVFLMDYVPLWGCVSLCGRRPEMEDAFRTLPGFYKVPLPMLTSEVTVDGFDSRSIQLPAHFFGVYDGHGGAQVADYCRESVHTILIEELMKLEFELSGSGVDLQNLWEKAFTNCFQRVDDVVGGKVSKDIVGCSTNSCAESSDHESSAPPPPDPVAPETVGSTAVVAVICSSHIIIANCGDSRAVLCRGKQAVPLSVDHKPNREDEYARIEAAGGKVIQWNGYRVFGVLAMSRSIGDRYLKPWIIPVPEVKIIPRVKEDECLILASDGLWDVMSNEEACDAARRRILLWHKKNGVTPVPPHKGEESDPAAQAAADYLTKLALQKGTKDNITVVVIDLKAQRKFKTKT